jgi:hypothetical protein
VILDKDKMAESNVDALSVMQMIQANNGSSQSGNLSRGYGISSDNGTIPELCGRCGKSGYRNFSEYAGVSETGGNKRWCF